MANKRFERMIRSRISDKLQPARVYAELGDYNGTVSTGRLYEVYARLRNGQVIRVYNYIAPLIKDLKVEIEKMKVGNDWQVVSFRNAYAFSSVPNVGDHNNEHRYLPVYRDQLVPLNFDATETPFILQIFGSPVIVDGVWATVENQTVDISAEVPTDGALWVLLQYDDSGAVTTVTGSTVESKELLTLADVPAPTSGNIAFGAVRLYDGQETLDRENDFLRPFNVSGVSSSGGLPTLDADRVAITDPSGNIVTDDLFSFVISTLQLVLGDRATFPFLGNGSIHLVQDGASPAFAAASYGESVAPFLVGFKADGTDASPTNVKAGQVIYRIRWRGHDGIGWSNTQAEIRGVAAADWSGTSHPIDLEFHTTPIGSTTLTLRMTIYNDGRIWVADDGRVSADNGLAFQRMMERNLDLDAGESLIVSEYVDLNGYEIDIDDDAVLSILE